MRVTLNGIVAADDDVEIYQWFGFAAFSPKAVRDAVASTPEGEELVLEINSGGGSVSAGSEIYSVLRSSGIHTVAEVQSLAASADQVLVTVEEVQTELQKMNLPRRLDQRTLEELMRTLRRYNLARPVGRLTGLDSRIEVFPTVLLALPDADLADAAAESSRTREELALYERPDGDASGEEEE